LKPDNCGFTASGQLKLFDFGLAKELKPSLKSTTSAGSTSTTCQCDDSYTLTGNTGSRRYMAPEVALEKPYGKSVDVYSFGILTWELLCAEKPFYGYSSNQHMEKVVLGGERPKMDSQHTSGWPVELVSLVLQCWSACPNSRPTFTEIIKVLHGILAPAPAAAAAAAVASTTTSSSNSATATITTPGMLESSTQIIPQRPGTGDETRSSGSSTTPPQTPMHTGKTTVTTSNLSYSPLSALFRATHLSPLKPLRSQPRSRSTGDDHHHTGGKTTTTTATTTTSALPVVGEQQQDDFANTAMIPPIALPGQSATTTNNRRAKSWGFISLRR
jgi:serine/threonine protein kinase